MNDRHKATEEARRLKVDTPCHKTKTRDGDTARINCACGWETTAPSMTQASRQWASHRQERKLILRRWHREFIGGPDTSRHHPEVP